MKDIAPELYEKIIESFRRKYYSASLYGAPLNDVETTLRNREATFRDADSYAVMVGDMLSQAMKEVLVLDSLPDKKLYYNIAKRTIGSALEENYRIVSTVAAVIQEEINGRAGIGLKPVKPEINTAAINKIIDRAAKADTQEKLDAALTEPVKTYPRTVVDDTIRENAKAQNNAGLEVKVTRVYDGVGVHNRKDVCQWCKSREGKEVPYKEAYARGMFERHDGCGCIIDYVSKKGERSRSTSKWGFERIEEPANKEANILSTTANENITIDYLKNATPGEGNIIKAPGFIDKGHAEENEFAEWLLDTLGGEIIHNADSTIKGERFADYTWNGKLWELKTITSSKYNTIDQHIRDANKQISSNRGGIMIDLTNNKLKRKDALPLIQRSMKNRKMLSTDVLIKDKSSFAIFRMG